MQIRSGIVYNSFKYTMYALLVINLGFFYEVNSAAEAATFKHGASLGDLIVAYADAIDSFAWIGLLLMFEIETSYTPPERYERWVGPLIGAITLLFWAGIVYSFYGYVGGLDMLRGFARYSGPDPCSLAGTGAQFAATLDVYSSLNAGNCQGLAAAAFYNADLKIFASPHGFSLIQQLKWLDIVNAGVWILLGVLIEIEIFMRVTRRATPKILRTLHIAQFPFWIVLVAAVIYWLALGEPVYGWDAFLWIVCFFFIELNMMAKHEHNARKRAGELPA
jgi:hypothetical protein